MRSSHSTNSNVAVNAFLKTNPQLVSIQEIPKGKEDTFKGNPGASNTERLLKIERSARPQEGELMDDFFVLRVHVKRSTDNSVLILEQAFSWSKTPIHSPWRVLFEGPCGELVFSERAPLYYISNFDPTALEFG